MSQSNSNVTSDRNLFRVLAINGVAAVLATGVVSVYAPHAGIVLQAYVGFLSASLVVWTTTAIVGAVYLARKTRKNVEAAVEVTTENYTLAQPAATQRAA